MPEGEEGDYGSITPAVRGEEGSKGGGGGGFSLCWRLFHGINYQLGGVFFVLGSVWYFPLFGANGVVIATFYSVGSANFLLADTQEFMTWAVILARRLEAMAAEQRALLDKADAAAGRLEKGEVEALRLLVINLFLSMAGSTLYLVGSLAFYPSFDAALLGDWGFIIGSAIIAVAQSWKVHRILASSSTTGGLRLSRIADGGNETAMGLELNAGIGGLCYLVGTCMYLRGVDLTAVYTIFVAGGLAFFASGAFLSHRHFVMGV